MRELDEGLEENADHLLAEIGAALTRIDEGTYGLCVNCGKPDRCRASRGRPVRNALHRRQARSQERAR